MKPICSLLGILLVVMLSAFPAILHARPDGRENDRPNILWLSAEDIGPQLGCYGDKVAQTPNLDALANRGMVYDVAWSNYPVCAPARSTIITGTYAATHGAGHMRSSRSLPKNFKMFPQYLRELGYYCSNNSKEDYNHPKPGKVWDESGNKADYSKRAAAQPFFAVYNDNRTHESRIRKRPHQAVTDPLQVKLPAYWPDRPEVREDWGQYYDNIAEMDQWVGNKLKELGDDGIAEDTIVVFFGDHGSGMPRHKRYAGDSGMRVPLIVYFPDKWKHLAPDDYGAGKHSDDLVGFVDFAPTVLSIAGIKPPDFMHGRAFAGKFQTQSEKYLYGFRGRMDERPDLSRSIRDSRFVYIRNYMPHLAVGQHQYFQQITPTTRVWREMFEKGELNPVQRRFFETHAPEELYDLQADPEETVNLADNREHRDVIAKFRQLHLAKTMEIRDAGFIPEPRLHQIAGQQAIQDFCSQDADYPLSDVLESAYQAAGRNVIQPDVFERMAESTSQVTRYWCSIGLRVRGKETCRENASLLKRLMDDESPSVAITAAESAAMYLDDETQVKAVELLLNNANFEKSDFYSATWALNSLDRIQVNRRSKSEVKSSFPIDWIDQIKSLPNKPSDIPRGNNYVERLIEKIVTDSKGVDSER